MKTTSKGKKLPAEKAESIIEEVRNRHIDFHKNLEHYICKCSSCGGEAHMHFGFVPLTTDDARFTMHVIFMYQIVCDKCGRMTSRNTELPVAIQEWVDMCADYHDETKDLNNGN
jgi:hypothetical protein